MANMISQSVLSILIFFPALMALLVLALPRTKDYRLHKHLVVGTTFVELLFALHLIRYFVPYSSDMQFAEVFNWLPPSTGIRYVVGVDGLSLILVVMTIGFGFIISFSLYNSVQKNIKAFLALFLFLESSLIGVFLSLDAVLFYVFWELSLIPVYFMIGAWGGPKRIYATTKLFIYGVIGSLLMLVALIYLYNVQASLHGGVYSASLIDLYQTASMLPFSTQIWLFLAVTLAFAIKTPLFPFHTWLPDVYEQAPPVYTLLSGVVLKLATYGLLRFSICLFPAVAAYFAKPIAILAVIGILYGALIAWQQKNIRRMMAYSSLSHMGFIVLGLFSLNVIGLQGALYQMLNHTVTAGALFVLFHFLYERRGSFDFKDFGGLARILPWYSFFFVLVAMSAVALPGTGSFIGEWLILLGSFQAHPVVTIFAVLGIVLGAVYILLAIYKILFGPVEEENKKIRPLSRAHTFQLVLLSFLIIALGFASSPLLQHTHATFLKIENTIVKKTPYSFRFFQIKDNRLVPLSVAHDAEKGVR